MSNSRKYIIVANAAKPVPRPPATRTKDMDPLDLATFKLLPNRLRLFKLSILLTSQFLQRTVKT